MIFINHAVSTFYKEKHILKNMHVHFNGHKMHEGVHNRELSALEEAFKKYDRIFNE